MSGTASELNDLLAAGELQVSVVSAVEYARNAAAYHLLPDLAITCDGPVHSVALFSRRPLAELDGRTVLLTASLAHLGPAARAALPPPLGHDAQVRHRAGRGEPTWTRSRGCRTRRCSSSATPRSCSPRSDRYPVSVDLGAEWKAWTGLPFVFAVWAARREAGSAAVRAMHRQLLASRAWGLAHLDELAARGRGSGTGVAETVCRDYLGDLDYALSYRHLAGLTDFFRRLAQDGLVPDGSLSFISAA